VAVINETLARTLWPDGDDPIGARITNEEPGDTDEWFTVVGIVRDFRSGSLVAAIQGEAYFVHPQLPVFRAMQVVMRIRGDAAPVIGAVADAVREFDGELTLPGFRDMQSYVERQSIQQRFVMTLLSVFSAVATALAAIGMYGVIAYGVSQRRHELGVRTALGARTADLVALVAHTGILPAVAGIVLGLFGAWGATRLMASLLFEVSPSDPYTFTSAAILAGAAALAASLVPALRVAWIDPAGVLRNH
jgi:hypothetical protein